MKALKGFLLIAISTIAFAEPGEVGPIYSADVLENSKLLLHEHKKWTNISRTNMPFKPRGCEYRVYIHDAVRDIPSKRSPRQWFYPTFVSEGFVGHKVINGKRQEIYDSRKSKIKWAYAGNSYSLVSSQKEAFSLNGEKKCARGTEFPGCEAGWGIQVYSTCPGI